MLGSRTNTYAALAVFYKLALAVFLLTLACRAVIESSFDIPLNWQYWHRDYLGNLVVALIAFALIQSFNKALVFSCVLIAMFQCSNAAKLSVLGTPASPDDFFNIQNFFFLAEGWRRWVLFFIASIPFLLGLAFIAWRKVSVWLTLLIMLCIGVSMNAYSEPLRVMLDKQLGNSVWNQPKNFRDRGLALHLTHETIRTMSKVDKPPMRDEVEVARLELAPDSTQERKLEPEYNSAIDQSDQTVSRNVHVFVLESFFDPVSLGHEWVPEDPLPESFRQLWEQTGHTQTLSPVFGGYTANAEFEMLCGFPVTRNAVFFEGWLRRSAPCLPRVLSELGYDTIASHPNVPGFWNRTHAYQLIGFDTYLSKADFDMSDSVGPLLLDASLYEQVFEHLERNASGAPVLNYMLTYHGHLPYPSNDNYPDKVAPGRESVLLNGYLNQIWYKSRDLMQRLDVLKREDPNSLIIIFGDHLPFLGPNYDVYKQAWGLPDDRSQYSGMQLQKLTSTPLIVIDGQRGPLELGDVPLYRLPSIVMALLGETDVQSFDASLNPERLRVRPVYGMHYTAQRTLSVACTEVNADQAPCNGSDPWLKQLQVLRSDIFTGKQFSLD